MSVAVTGNDVTLHDPVYTTSGPKVPVKPTLVTTGLMIVVVPNTVEPIIALVRVIPDATVPVSTRYKVPASARGAKVANEATATNNPTRREYFFIVFIMFLHMLR